MINTNKKSRLMLTFFIKVQFYGSNFSVEFRVKFYLSEEQIWTEKRLKKAKNFNQKMNNKFLIFLQQ